jgi:stage V sporulation protein S
MEFRVSARSDPRKVARAIVNTLGRTPSLTLSAIGDTAVSHALKATSIARKHVPGDNDIMCLTFYKDAFLNGRDCTIVQIIVKQVIV